MVKASDSTAIFQYVVLVLIFSPALYLGWCALRAKTGRLYWVIFAIFAAGFGLVLYNSLLRKPKMEETTIRLQGHYLHIKDWKGDAMAYDLAGTGSACLLEANRSSSGRSLSRDRRMRKFCILILPNGRYTESQSIYFYPDTLSDLQIQEIASHVVRFTKEDGVDEPVRRLAAGDMGPIRKTAFDTWGGLVILAGMVCLIWLWDKIGRTLKERRRKKRRRGYDFGRGS